MEVYSAKTTSILPLGKQGENLVRQIQFDLSRWTSNFGPGTVQLLHKRSGDETPYPVAVEQEGNLAVWTVTNADTAAAGTGRAELQYYVGDALAKSETWMTKVLAALGPAGETPPEAQQGWVDHVLAEVARITGMTAQAVELPAGSAPTADYADGVLTIGIPLGGDVSETQIARAVADYLSENPIAETDPTVPAWAKAETKPAYTAAEVGADPSGTAAGRVSEHNTETTAHNDMRLLIQGLTDRLNALADSDDTTLDQLSEIVAYIKSNRDLIAAVTTDKVSATDIVNDLVTNAAAKPLSAAQGVALKALIDSLSEEIANLPSASVSGAGWSTEEIALLEIILGKAVYSSDQTNNIAALIALLKSNSSGSEGDSGGGDSSGTTYTVTLNLDGVTPSNMAKSVSSGSVYANQLSVADGHALGTPVVTMGGYDVTSQYYDGEGNITIPSVQGDIVITCKALAVETLNIVSLGTSWPNPATFEYTATTSWSQLVLAEGSQTTGGYVGVSWDTKSITGGPAVRLYLFKDGEPYKRGGNTNGNGDAIDGINGNWDEPGSSNYFGSTNTTEPFRVQIPDGCTVMVALQRGTLASDAITSNGTFATWVRDGGLTVMKVEGE